MRAKDLGLVFVGARRIIANDSQLVLPIPGPADYPKKANRFAKDCPLVDIDNAYVGLPF